MFKQVRCLMAIAMLVLVSAIQGLQFSMNITLDDIICGNLKCVIDTSPTDGTIFFLNSLGIYDVTQPNSPVKLTSVSAFEPGLFVNLTPSNVSNATGTISKFNAELTLALTDSSYCLNAHFLCQLDFLNTTRDPDVIKKTVSAETILQCYSSEKNFYDVKNELAGAKNDLAGAKNDLAGAKNDLAGVKNELAEKVKENAALKAELATLTTTLNLYKQECSKGAPHNNTREKFMLWNRVPALCDTETDGGGWVIIQRRTNGELNFYKNWAEYKNGFGTPDSDFWIGNDGIHNLTSQSYTELRIDLEYKGKHYFAHFSQFSVANETLNYRLSVSGYSGTAGDSLTYNNNMDFSTFDRDHDHANSNCAQEHYGAWWYNYCTYCNLNGRWGGTDGGVEWLALTADSDSVTFSEMKIRRV